jgi:hypothetical protein
MELKEAQLFRLLSALLGKERVIYGMSVATVCGGSVLEPHIEWAESNKCLFAIINEDDIATLVVELFSPTASIIDMAVIERREKLPNVLQAAGIRYVTFTDQEVSEVLEKQNLATFTSLFQAKLNDMEEQ